MIGWPYSSYDRNKNKNRIFWKATTRKKMKDTEDYIKICITKEDFEGKHDLLNYLRITVSSGEL
jgi:hypothetical protein